MVNFAGQRIAVICHIHYENIWEEDIKPRLLNAWFNYDLYVSISDFGNRDRLVDKILLDFPKANIKILPNLGEDIRGFVYWANHITSSDIEYDYVLKIHTKGSNEKWRKSLFDALIPMYDNSLGLQESMLAKCGMMSCSEYVMYQCEKDKTDIEYVPEICKMIGCNIPKGFCFCAGTMFWIRFNLIKRFLTIDKLPSEYFDMKYAKCKTKMHSMERVFGMIAMQDGGMIQPLSKASYEPVAPKVSPNSVAICAIAKLENMYLKEWVEYHKSIGVEKIYLYDNNDTDGEIFSDSIKDYIVSGYVQVVSVRGYVRNPEMTKLCGQQEESYMDCYERFGRYHKWIAYIDIDEFIVVPNNDVTKYFNSRKFSKFSQIKLNWKCFTDNKLVHYENSPVMDRFTEAAPIDFVMHDGRMENSHIKAIVRTNKNIKRIPVHYVEFIDNKEKSCNAEGVEVTTNSPFCDNISHNVAWINHYNTKTIEEYLIRRTLSNISTGQPEIELSKRIEWFFNENEDTQEKRDVIELFVKKMNRIKDDGEFNTKTLSQKAKELSISKRTLELGDKPKLATYVLSIGTKINPARFIPRKSEIFNHNCRGELFGLSYQELASSMFYGEAEWYLIIKDSAVSDCPERVMTAIENIIDESFDIGVYSPSSISVPRDNKSFTQKTGKLRDVDYVDDHIVLVNACALKGISRLNFSVCRSGNGFIDYLCALAKNNGFRNVVDDTVSYSIVGELRKPIYAMQTEKERLYKLNNISDKIS